MTRKTIGIIVAPLIAPLVWMPTMFVARLISGYSYELAKNMSGYGSFEAFIEMLVFVPITFIPLSFGVMFMLGIPFINNLTRKGRTSISDFVKVGIFIGMILGGIALLFIGVGTLWSEVSPEVPLWKDLVILTIAMVLTSTCCAIAYWIVAVRGTRAI
jgi:hypothetical protein